MAPALTAEELVQPSQATFGKAAPQQTPLTSGQHEPLYDQLAPYSEFPKEIRGPTVWKAEDYTNNPERWTHPFSQEEIAELGAAADSFIASGKDLTGITKVGRS